MMANLLDLPTLCDWHSHEAVELAPPLKAGPCDAKILAQAIDGLGVQPSRCLHSAGEISWGLPDLRTTVSLSEYCDEQT